MGRPRPMNGTVGATKKKLQQVKAALDAKNYEVVNNFLKRAIKACDEEYIIMTAEGEIIE